jgi:hypothetical protein
MAMPRWNAGSLTLTVAAIAWRRFVVVDHDFAGEQLGHAGGVVLDDELLQLHVEGQVLQHHAVGLAQDGRASARALGHHQVAAEGGVAGDRRCSGFTSPTMPPPL